MTIQDTYQKYQIPPALQTHQYRVAAVAQMIAESISGQKIDAENIVRACLLHDMGNIIKFNMSLFPDFFQPEGVEYWNKVKQSFIEKYGRDEHLATMEIAREILGLNFQFPLSNVQTQWDPNRIIDLIDAIGFSNARRNYESSDFGWKIAAYADMRVEPHGVTSLKKRLEDGHKRFNINKPGESREDFFWEMAGYLEKIEAQIFERSSLNPQDITETQIQAPILKLQSIHI